MKTPSLEEQVLALSPRQLAEFRMRFSDAVAGMLKKNPSRFPMTDWTKSLIKEATALPSQDISKLIESLTELEASTWDAQIENDSRSGALDFLAQEALKEYNEGKTDPL